jgi:radical SAM superfamily enzyme YgiQ (UPF0313 family)
MQPVTAVVVFSAGKQIMPFCGFHGQNIQPAGRTIYEGTGIYSFGEAMKQESAHYDVLLCYPSDCLRVFDSMIPLGIASIAAVAQTRGYSVKIVDFNHYQGDYRRDLKRWAPKIIGIGGTTSSRKGSFLTARLSKQVLPNVPVVYGGVHATFSATDTLMHVPQIDYVVKGEGEYTFASLAAKSVENSSLDVESLSGVCYRDGSRIVENAPKRIDNLDLLPIPARHLFDYRYNIKLDFRGLPADFLMTSRGCPAACTFCSASRMFGGGVRCRSMDHVAMELAEILAARRISALKLFDSTFTAGESHVLAFCNMIGPYRLYWECEIRADTVTRQLLMEMKRAGCCYVNVGLETTSPRLLKNIAKNISVEQVDACLRWCKELGINTKLFMVCGLLGQHFDECLHDLAFIRGHRRGIDFFATTVGLRVYPGTALESRLKRIGYLHDGFSWAKFAAPLSNLMVMEPGDVLILRQKQLGILKLSVILLLLVSQRTMASGGYILKVLKNNLLYVVRFLELRVRYFHHTIARAVEGFSTASIQDNMRQR